MQYYFNPKHNVWRPELYFFCPSPLSFDHREICLLLIKRKREIAHTFFMAEATDL